MLAGAFGMVASCLVVLSARTRAMMNLSIGAREYGYWLGAANLFLGIRALSSRSMPSWVIPLLNLFSGMVLLAPALWARALADDLRRKSIDAFGDAPRAPKSEPFR